MNAITPCLWFDGNAEEAVAFYSGIFKSAKVIDTLYYGEGLPMPAGSVLTITFELDGNPFIALNGGPQYKFTPALSLSVECATQEEVDRFWTRLTDGGKEVACGWLEDKYGVSWQIVPTVLPAMLKDPDKARAARVFQAMVHMVKLDIAALQRAYDGR
jgi:predicted 3-demethylubiquinone-9 3-methyltransferase (glyoxalase superfamily)